MHARNDIVTGPSAAHDFGTLAYFLTFTTFGTWLHGDERGSVDRDHNEFQATTLDPDAAREFREWLALKREPVTLDARLARARGRA